MFSFYRLKNFSHFFLFLLKVPFKFRKEKKNYCRELIKKKYFWISNKSADWYFPKEKKKILNCSRVVLFTNRKLFKTKKNQFFLSIFVICCLKHYLDVLVYSPSDVKINTNLINKINTVTSFRNTVIHAYNYIAGSTTN